MVDRQKVIKGLECCKEACAIGGCPYWNGSITDGSCMLKLHADALSMLKEQEPKPVIQERQCEVEPTVWERKGFCPKCHQIVRWSVNRLFCGFCGQEVKWNAG